jgi:flagellar hook-length control protein FliK
MRQEIGPGFRESPRSAHRPQPSGNRAAHPGGGTDEGTFRLPASDADPAPPHRAEATASTDPGKSSPAEASREAAADVLPTLEPQAGLQAQTLALVAFTLAAGEAVTTETGDAAQGGEAVEDADAPSTPAALPGPVAAVANPVVVQLATPSPEPANADGATLSAPAGMPQVGADEKTVFRPAEGAAEAPLDAFEAEAPAIDAAASTSASGAKIPSAAATAEGPVAPGAVEGSNEAGGLDAILTARQAPSPYLGKADRVPGAAASPNAAAAPEPPPPLDTASRASADGPRRPVLKSEVLARVEPALEAQGGPLSAEWPHPTAGSSAAAPAVPTLPEPARGAVPVVQHVPLAALPVEIGVKSLAGVNRFEIRLDPPELGRVEVRLEIEGGEVKAQLVVDRVETLALLQRDAKTLERAFEQAGLKPSEGGVDLTLRERHPEGRGQGRGEESGDRPDERPEARARHEEPAPLKPIRTIWRTARGLDLRI